VLAILTTALAFVLPVLILTLVIAAFALTIWLLPKIIRLAGRTFGVARRAFAGNASVAR
jgi:type IV secretory pathway TrbD component